MSFEKRPAVFSRETLDELQNTRGIPNDSWYVIAAATLCCLNRPDDLILVFKHAIESAKDPQEQMRIARRIREALIKSAGICGLPRASTYRPHEIYASFTPDGITSYEHFLTDDARIDHRRIVYLEGPHAEESSRQPQAPDSQGEGFRRYSCGRVLCKRQKVFRRRIQWNFRPNDERFELVRNAGPWCHGEDGLRILCQPYRYSKCG